MVKSIKADIKKLYSKDQKLALEVAKVLGYKITAKKSQDKKGKKNLLDNIDNKKKLQTQPQKNQQKKTQADAASVKKKIKSVTAGIEKKLDEFAKYVKSINGLASRTDIDKSTGAIKNKISDLRAMLLSIASGRGFTG